MCQSENATVHAPNKDYYTVSIYVYIRASLVADSTKTPRDGSAPSYSFQSPRTRHRWSNMLRSLVGSWLTVFAFTSAGEPT